jgi:hypothetical protein
VWSEHVENLLSIEMGVHIVRASMERLDSVSY